MFIALLLLLLLLMMMMLMTLVMTDSLITLELFGLFVLTHVALDSIRQHCTSLRTLNVGQCWKVSLTSS